MSVEMNADQVHAVQHTDTPLLIIAGAGSGKTKVITNKIAHLINEKNISPFNILGLTFTNRAANEMKKRVEALTKIDAQLFNISTFHSLGLKILRESGTEAGFDRDWQIMDDMDQKRVIERIIKDQLNHYTNEMRDGCVKKINLAKMKLCYPNNPDLLMQKGFSLDEVEIFRLYFRYQKEKKLWDYEDLVSLAVKLLQSSETLKKMTNKKYQYILVDEFQDTNPNQYELIKLLADKSLAITVVGDDDQAIYSWRGANIRFLFDFEQDFPGTKILKLEQNYRSTPQILNFANEIIKTNTYRRSKLMWTEQKSGKPVFLLNSISKEDEAEKVASIILRLQDHHPEVFPMAILYRINSQSLAFETEFLNRNINFRIIKGTRFFERKEVKDSISLLKLAVNPDNDTSFLRMLNFLPLGIGTKTLEKIDQQARKKKLSLFSTLKTHFPDKYKSRSLFSKIFDLNKKKNEFKFSEILTILLKHSSYLKYLEEKKEESRLLNIDELIEFIIKWETENVHGDFSELLDRISLDRVEKESTKAITVFLLTMHNAKGLEFPSVFVAGVNSTYMPFFLRKGAAEIEEERRLLYVATTRAKRQLIISSGSKQPSRFISRLSHTCHESTYSLEELLEKLAKPADPNTSPTDPEPVASDRYVEHPIFGKGRILNEIDQTKLYIDFFNRGEKLIDTSLIKIKFLC